MLIRRIEATDLTQLLQLYHELHPQEDLPSEDALSRVWPQLLTDSRVTVFVRCDEATLVSTCTLTVIPNLTRGAHPYALIENVVTRRDYRNSGHGTAILEHALAYAWEEGCYKVMLLSRDEPEEMLRFYEGAGLNRSTKIGFVARPPGSP